jgi:hypothetical protein
VQQEYVWKYLNRAWHGCEGLEIRWRQTSRLVCECCRQCPKGVQNRDEGEDSHDIDNAPQRWTRADDERNANEEENHPSHVKVDESYSRAPRRGAYEVRRGHRGGQLQKLRQRPRQQCERERQPQLSG